MPGEITIRRAHNQKDTSSRDKNEKGKRFNNEKDTSRSAYSERINQES
jgi:hypothetical protein